jgi:DNA-binding LytR/AlgR family response regulator
MKPRLSIVSLRTTIYYPLKRVIMLKAEGSYTTVYIKEKDGTVAIHMQSPHLGYYISLLDYDFFRPSRSYIVNQRYVYGTGRNRTIYIAMPKTYPITVPKKAWKDVKEMLNLQLVIPFGNKGSSLPDLGSS